MYLQPTITERQRDRDRDRSGQVRDTQEQPEEQSQEAGQVGVGYGTAGQGARAGQRRVQCKLTWRGDRAAEDCSLCGPDPLPRTTQDMTAMQWMRCGPDAAPMDHDGPGKHSQLGRGLQREITIQSTVHIHTCALSEESHACDDADTLHTHHGIRLH